jgi:ketosteroid isomerase-like protein
MTRTTLDPMAFVHALVARDADGLAALYAADAVVTMHDKDHPPGAPMVLEGREAIHAWYRDVCGRNVEHEVATVIDNDQGFAFEEQCRYPSGEGVVCVALARVEDGLITSQTGSQTWDG